MRRNVSTRWMHLFKLQLCQGCQPGHALRQPPHRGVAPDAEVGQGGQLQRVRVDHALVLDAGNLALIKVPSSLMLRLHLLTHAAGCRALREACAWHHSRQSPACRASRARSTWPGPRCSAATANLEAVPPVRKAPLPAPAAGPGLRASSDVQVLNTGSAHRQLPRRGIGQGLQIIQPDDGLRRQRATDVPLTAEALPLFGGVAVPAADRRQLDREAAQRFQLRQRAHSAIVIQQHREAFQLLQRRHRAEVERAGGRVVPPCASRMAFEEPQCAAPCRVGDARESCGDNRGWHLTWRVALSKMDISWISGRVSLPKQNNLFNSPLKTGAPSACSGHWQMLCSKIGRHSRTSRTERP